MIPFIQFIRPHGLRRYTEITRPEEIEKLARDLINLGYVFEIEELTTGEISMECLHHENEHSAALEICKNGPDVPVAVDKLVKTAHENI
jgi:hypothetical protein